jgi:hypothetical protein
MSYWVSWMAPIKRARLHKANCPHCRNGEGQKNQDRNGGGNTGWKGPFEMLVAEAVLDDLKNDQGYDAAKCRVCKP